jgi:uncharacterized protein YacL
MIEIIQLIILIGIAIAVFGQYNGAKFKSKSSIAVLDSSALIDGRILEVAKAGFTPDKLVVPKFIVNELQLLADGNDSHKRERARFGLDVVAQLQAELPNSVELSIINFNDIRATDDKLVKLASKLGADLCTTDYNLNKVATIEGVRVLNLNELSQAVRPAALPGEKHSVKIVQKGSSKDQGVGYLDDGTMVVVAGAGQMIGKRVDVAVTRMLQTEAGKMIFAKLAEAPRPNRKNTVRKN